MKIICAPNAFKESITSVEAAKVMAKAAKDAGIEDVLEIPVGDGGDGTLDALRSVIGGEIVEFQVTGPNWKPVVAPILLFNDGKSAFVEMAKASGLALVPLDERDPFQTTSYGTGELIRYAISLGVDEIILGVGGSATMDGGIGALKALGFKFIDVRGDEVRPTAEGLVKIRWIDDSDVFEGVKRVKIRIMVDVMNPLVGSHGAARVYGPQKGAKDEDLPIIDAGLANLANKIRRKTGRDIMNLPGAGAAGGISGSFHGLLNASIEHGIGLFLELVKFDKLLEDTDFVFTGEGKLDRQTVFGKAPMGVLKAAQKRNVPVVAFAGIVEDWDELHKAGFLALFSIVPGPVSLGEALKNASTYLYQTTFEVSAMLKKAVERKI